MSVDETTNNGNGLIPGSRGPEDDDFETRPGEELHKLKYLSGMYQNWFLDYASYVILERAVPLVFDGFKPVQRRILHSMRRMEDGRYNKVANIIGHTMQFHPHGDASIGDALVQLGQKDLIIDMQGNWGNVHTGDRAAAARYIEARLSKFALEVVFNPKTTDWKLSYDGRNKEPISLPVKFPMLLAQGVEGIAVGMASKVLPHNFNELLDASIQFLKGEPFQLFPDFNTGGMIDVSRYNDGLRGGKVRVRAKIDIVDKKTLVIRELPYGQNTGTLIDSILAANQKGKIKIKKVDDNTSADVEIVVYLTPGVNPDQTIDALYAFTNCEVSISPNCAIIQDHRPYFMTVSEVLRLSTNNTLALLRKELEIRLGELNESWHMSSLERIFIENRIYNSIEDCETWDDIIQTIDKGLDPFKKLLRREVTVDDITKLTEIRIKRISRFDAFKADEYIKGLEAEIKVVEHHLANIVEYTIDYFDNIRKKHGKDKVRRTEIRNFDTIEAAEVAVNNEKLYISRTEGFVGTSLKKDEYLFDCSDLDDIIIFHRNGDYQIIKVAEKVFIGPNPLHVAVFRKNDERTTYNVVYLDGQTGFLHAKRFFVKGITRDKMYNLTKGNEHSKVVWFTANTNGEAESVKVFLKPKPRLKYPVLVFDFTDQLIKNRNSFGNIVTRHSYHKVVLHRNGESTLGGQKIWFDPHTMRLNQDERGQYLGQFNPKDRILEVNQSGEFRTINADLNTQFLDEVNTIEKFDSQKVYTAVYWDANQEFYYIKRFTFEESERRQHFIDENKKSFLKLITSAGRPMLKCTYKGRDAGRPEDIIDAVEFISEKSVKAKGKRFTSYDLDSITVLASAEPEEEELDDNDELLDAEVKASKHRGIDFEIIRPDAEQGELEL